MLGPDYLAFWVKFDFVDFEEASSRDLFLKGTISLSGFSGTIYSC